MSGPRDIPRPHVAYSPVGRIVRPTRTGNPITVTLAGDEYEWVGRKPARVITVRSGSLQLLKKLAHECDRLNVPCDLVYESADGMTDAYQIVGPDAALDRICELPAVISWHYPISAPVPRFKPEPGHPMPIPKDAGRNVRDVIRERQERAAMKRPG